MKKKLKKFSRLALIMYICIFTISSIQLPIMAAPTAPGVIESFLDPNGPVLVGAHRSDHLHYPENSMAAYQSDIDRGVDMIEIDTQMTADGVLVLMHDNTVDRTTNGTGAISSMTLEQIKNLYLRQGEGGSNAEITTERVPTLEEALNLIKQNGNIMVNLDKSWDYRDACYNLLIKTGTLRQALFKSDRPNSEVQPWLDSKNPRPYYSAIISDSNLSDLTGLLAGAKPECVEIQFDSESDQVIQDSVIKQIKDAHSRVWVNSLWDSLCAGHTDDVSSSDPAKGWGWLINKGTNILLSDRPMELMNYLRPPKAQKLVNGDGWTSQDIGGVGALGHSEVNEGVFSVAGSGWDVYGANDEFQYVYKELRGDCTITSRVDEIKNLTDSVTINPWTKAGLMIRSSLKSEDKMAYVAATVNNGVVFQRRYNNGEYMSTAVNSDAVGGTAPVYIKISRSGSSISAFQSSDGVSWNQIGTAQTINMGEKIYVGMFVTSHNDGTLCQANFSGVKLEAGHTDTLQQGLNGYTGARDVHVKLNPTKNTANTGANDVLEIGAYRALAEGTAPFDINKILMSFDLSQVPQNAVITSAELDINLVATRNEASTPSRKTFNLHKITSAWEEGNGKGIDGQVVGSSGVTGANGLTCPQYDAESLGSNTVGAQLNTWYSYPITGLVQGWINNPSGNYGLLLVEDAPSPLQGSKDFASAQYANQELRPKLVLSYYLEEMNISSSTQIDEGKEDGAIIKVDISGGEFSSSLNKANWSIENLPEGVNIDTVTRLGNTEAEIRLSGNRTVDFENDINLIVKCTAGEFVESARNNGWTSSNSVVIHALDNSQAVAEDADVLAIIFANGESKDGVAQDMTFPAKGINGTDITWQSGDIGHVDASGKVTRPLSSEESALVDITATISKGEEAATRVFQVRILKQPADDAEAVQQVADSLGIGYAAGDGEASVTKDIVLIGHAFNDTAVAWSSMSPDVIGSDGKVARPAFLSGDAEVELQAAIRKNNEELVKTFKLNVIKLSITDMEAVAVDSANLAIGYGEGDSQNSITKNVTLPQTGANGAGITWSSSNTAILSNDGIVSRPAYSAGDADIELTAVISKNGESITKTFYVKVRKLDPADTDMVQLAKQNLNIQFAEGDSLSGVTKDMVLPVQYENGVSIAWISSNDNFADSTGKIVRPSFTKGDVSVSLTALITKNNAKEIKKFDITLAKKAPVTGEEKEQSNALFQQGYEGYTGAKDVHVKMNSRTNPSKAIMNTGANNLLEIGAYRALAAGDTPFDINKILISFDLSSIPANAVITNADLEFRLMATRNEAGSGSYKTFNLHKITGPWIEGNGTGIDGQQAVQTQPLANGGIYGQTGDTCPQYDSASLGSNTVGVELNTWYSYPVTSLVQEWVDQPQTNMGALLVEDNPSPLQGSKDFASAQYADQESRPRLVVTYYIQDGDDGDDEKPVQSIRVTGEGNADTVEKGSTLAMHAEVLPADAEDTSVTWSVAPGTGNAQIDPVTGILTGIDAGTVTVTATANDGSQVSGNKVITITGEETQPGERYTIKGADNGLVRTQGIRATVTVGPENNYQGRKAVVVFELMKGSVPVEIMAINNEFDSEKEVTAYFTVNNSADTTYTVKVFVLDQWDNGQKLPESKADSIIMN